MIDILTVLEEKRQRLAALRPLPRSLEHNLEEWFKIELTYTSNAIEGNTLSRAETALVVEKGLTVEGKTVREHLEAVNHAQAFDWVLGQLRKNKDLEVTQDLILEIHRLILQKIDDQDAGRYRTIPVRITGSRVVMPNAVKVPELMKQFVSWLKQNPDNPVKLAAEMHFRFVSIHPFVDGNGRTARLLMNLVLLKAGYPPAIIRKEDRQKYIASIEKGQLGGSLAEYNHIIYEAIDKSLDVYLKSQESGEQEKVLATKPSLKIGDLAKLTNESVPTIRHWTKLGLLRVTDYTPSGYQIYNPEMVKVVAKIRRLQMAKRYTLVEIKRELAK